MTDQIQKLQAELSKVTAEIEEKKIRARALKLAIAKAKKVNEEITKLVVN